MALPNAHVNPTVPTLAHSVSVYSMAACFQNAQCEKVDCNVYLLSRMKWFTRFIPFPPHTSLVVEDCGDIKVESSIAKWLPQEKLRSWARGNLQL